MTAANRFLIPVSGRIIKLFNDAGWNAEVIAGEHKRKHGFRK
jgi:hypothetical protein